jgi:hypothetical protein
MEEDQGREDSQDVLQVWKKVLAGEEVDFSHFAQSRPPLEVLSVVLAQIHGLYQDAIESKRPLSGVVPAVGRLMPAMKLARRRAGPQQREIDLHLMRVLRHGGHLCAVLGAGVTMDAGGPSWPQLVRRLLAIGLGDGFEIVQTKPKDQLRFTDMLFGTAERVVGHNPFTPAQREEACAIADAIDANDATTEMLKRGAELCLEAAGQRLFADVTAILYEGGRAPGAVHCALAELAEPQKRLGPGDPHGYGWSSLITYNFDDLMGEALDQRDIARAAYAMRGLDVVGDPNAIAKRQGQDRPHLPVLHLHGYTPRRYFYITNVKFVFATSQYATEYAADQRPILDSVFEQFLANPSQRAVYIGCSFQDEYMNDLLEKSRRHLPGAEHWAFLRWPGPGRYGEATPEELEHYSQRYVAFGVRPVWYEGHHEIPEMILKLK